MWIIWQHFVINIDSKLLIAWGKSNSGCFGHSHIIAKKSSCKVQIYMPKCEGLHIHRKERSIMSQTSNSWFVTLYIYYTSISSYMWLVHFSRSGTHIKAPFWNPLLKSGRIKAVFGDSVFSRFGQGCAAVSERGQHQEIWSSFCVRLKVWYPVCFIFFCYWFYMLFIYRSVLMTHY